jgi:type I restriction enzyme S subunit
MGEIIMTDRPSFTNQQINSIVTNGQVDPSFLYYSIRPRKAELLSLGAAIGVRTPILKKSSFCELRVKLPPLLTQKKIAAVLSAYDDLLERNNRRIEHAGAMLRWLYGGWFEKFQFPGQPRSATGGDAMPDGWRVVSLQDVASLQRGIEPGSNAYVGLGPGDVIPFLRVGDLSVRQSRLGIQKDLTYGCTVTPLEIVMSFDGTPGIVRVGLTGAFSSGIRKIVPSDPDMGWAFLYCLLQSDRIQDVIRAHSRGTTIVHAGSAIPFLTALLPPKSLMNRFEAIGRPLLEFQINIQALNSVLRTTRDFLSPRLISGELDVSDLDIPEAVA